jgi:hypothetical protein
MLYPDVVLTPGAVFDSASSDVVCVPGYTRTVRNVSSAERAQVYAEYGLADVPGADEVDHFIALELGGSNDIVNLWPEPYAAPGARRARHARRHSREWPGLLVQRPGVLLLQAIRDLVLRPMLGCRVLAHIGDQNLGTAAAAARG